MSRPDDDPLEDCGLEWADVAATASVVYARLAGTEAGDDAGWAAVAKAAGAMFGYDDGADEGDVSIPLAQLSSQLRRAYARAADTDDAICEWDALADKFKVAWEGVTRHLSNVFRMDKKEASRLGSHEDRMVAFMQKRAARVPATN